MCSSSGFTGSHRSVKPHHGKHIPSKSRNLTHRIDYGGETSTVSKVKEFDYHERVHQDSLLVELLKRWEEPHEEKPWPLSK